MIAIINNIGKALKAVAGAADAMRKIQQQYKCEYDFMDHLDDGIYAQCSQFDNNTSDNQSGGYVPQLRQAPVDPLVLDLNHDGQISTTSLADSTAFFDLNGDKFAEHTAWIGKEDGILFLDKNGNGRVDDINEVFGGNGKDGIT